MTVKEFMTVSDLGSSVRYGFKNFRWTQEAIHEWEKVWCSLWRIGIKWEWQNGDKYARRRGDLYAVFSVHNDAMRLDMTVPLPNRDAVVEMYEYLLDLPTDDFEVDEASNLIRKWIKNYGGKIEDALASPR